MLSTRSLNIFRYILSLLEDAKFLGEIFFVFLDLKIELAKMTFTNK